MVGDPPKWFSSRKNQSHEPVRSGQEHAEQLPLPRPQHSEPRSFIEALLQRSMITTSEFCQAHPLVSCRATSVVRCDEIVVVRKVIEKKRECASTLQRR